MPDVTQFEWAVPSAATAREPGPPPSFSVGIAAFQSAQVIGDALESLLAQTRPPEEIIVCDDGSTDDLESALRPYLGSITLLKQQNGGEGSAKNATVRAASTEFVAILDADDTYLPARLEALGALAAARPDLDILTTDAYLEAGGEVVRRCYTADWTFEVDDQRTGILERNFIFGHVAVRRDRFLSLGGFDETIRWTTDWDCWLRMILGGSRAGCVMEPLAVYRVHQQSLSADRGRLVAGRLETLTKAAHRDDLSNQERAVLEQSTARYQRELSLLELRAALQEGKPDVRARALRVARNANYPRRIRFNAMAAALLPGLAGRRERRRAASSWVGAGGTHVVRN